MSMDLDTSHAARMDGVYRHQRHIYDLTRKYYLLGRDGMIAGLDVPPGGSVLEIGCGTGRNLILTARKYPGARLFGLDISSEMLATARHNLDREGIAERVKLAQADATAFSPERLFDQPGFDRVYLSYALSMIPDWERALDQAASVLGPGGSLHIVDFGQQEALPRWFGQALHAWLARFHVTPRAGLPAALERCARKHGATTTLVPLYHGYAWQGVLRPEASA